LNDKKLSVASGGKVGVYRSGKAAVFWSSQYTASKTLSFHVTNPEHQIALRGSKGVLALVDVTNPNTDSVPRGQLMEWSTFVVGKGGRVTINDGSDIPSRKWVAYQDGSAGWQVALYDGKSLLTGVILREYMTKYSQDIHQTQSAHSRTSICWQLQLLRRCIAFTSFLETFRIGFEVR
jgi:hypothetical protein